MCYGVPILHDNKLQNERPRVLKNVKGYHADDRRRRGKFENQIKRMQEKVRWHARVDTAMMQQMDARHLLMQMFVPVKEENVRRVHRKKAQKYFERIKVFPRQDRPVVVGMTEHTFQDKVDRDVGDTKRRQGRAPDLKVRQSRIFHDLVILPKVVIDDWIDTRQNREWHRYGNVCCQQQLFGKNIQQNRWYRLDKNKCCQI